MSQEHADWKVVYFIAGVVLIALGLFVVISSGSGAFSAFSEMRFAHMHHFDSHNPDTSVVRSWMSIEYVASAYHIPREYLFRQTGIPMTQQNGVLSFRVLGGGAGAESEASLSRLLKKVQTAVDLYRRRNPPGDALRGSGALLQHGEGSIGSPRPGHE